MRELDKARAYAESLIKNAPDPVFVSDLDGKILQANEAVFALLGLRPADRCGVPSPRFAPAMRPSGPIWTSGPGASSQRRKPRRRGMGGSRRLPVAVPKK